MNVVTMNISLFDRVEKIVEKKRKYWLSAFSPFSTMFSYDLFFRVIQSRDYTVKS